MPYKDPVKQREACRIAVQKYRKRLKEEHRTPKDIIEQLKQRLQEIEKLFNIDYTYEVI